MDHISQTRAMFNLRLGELVEAAIGSSKLRELFDAAEQGGISEQFQIAVAERSGQAASGQLALQKGIVDPETKNALLTAQAAERTWQTLEKLEHFYKEQLPEIEKRVASFQRPKKAHQETFQRPKKAHQDDMDAFMENFRSPYTEMVEAYYEEHVSKADLNNTAFKFIGSEGDPETLVCAQAAHHLVTLYEHNEKNGQKEELIAQFMRVSDYRPYGMVYGDAFKQAIAASYKEAGRVLGEKGFEDIATRLDDVCKTISYDAENANTHTISDFANQLVSTQYRLAQDANIILGGPYHTVNEEWEKKVRTRAKQAHGCRAA